MTYLSRKQARWRSSRLKTRIRAVLILCAAITSPSARLSFAESSIGLRVADSLQPFTEEVLTPLPAIEEAELSLEDLEQWALSSNPSVQRAAALVGAANGNWVQVGLLPNPTVGYEGQQLGSGGLAEQQGVLFSQEFVRGGKLRLNRAVAANERMRLEQELIAQQQRVLTDVRVAYYQVLLAQRQVQITNDLIQISTEGASAVDSLFQSKEVGRTDVLQSQLEVENARILSQNSQNRHRAAWQSLTAVVGAPDLTTQQLSGEIDGPPQHIEFEDALGRLLAQSPELAAASVAIERARASVARETVEPVPNVTVQGLVNVIDNGIGGKTDGGIAVSVPIPIFNKNQGGIARAQQELVAASRARTQLELDLQNRLAPVYEKFANASNQVQRYRDIILPAAEEALGLSRKTYSAGEANYISLLTAQRTYSQTQLGYLDAIGNLRIAEVQINGLLLSGSLQASPSSELGGTMSSGIQTEPAGAIGLVPK